MPVEDDTRLTVEGNFITTETISIIVVCKFRKSRGVVLRDDIRFRLVGILRTVRDAR